jgi:hypothetical protein
MGGKRKNKSKKNNMMGGKKNKNNMTGGKRKGTKKRSTRKLSNGASNWQGKVMKVYKELKAKNPQTKLGDAMREASKRKKQGKL